MLSMCARGVGTDTLLFAQEDVCCLELRVELRAPGCLCLLFVALCAALHSVCAPFSQTVMNSTNGKCVRVGGSNSEVSESRYVCM